MKLTLEIIETANGVSTTIESSGTVACTKLEYERFLRIIDALTAIPNPFGGETNTVNDFKFTPLMRTQPKLN